MRRTERSQRVWGGCDAAHRCSHRFDVVTHSLFGVIDPPHAQLGARRRSPQATLDSPTSRQAARDEGERWAVGRDRERTRPSDISFSLSEQSCTFFMGFSRPFWSKVTASFWSKVTASLHESPFACYSTLYHSLCGIFSDVDLLTMLRMTEQIWFLIWLNSLFHVCTVNTGFTGTYSRRYHQI